jgi:transcriptional regulator with XRE-family HTH domain
MRNLHPFCAVKLWYIERSTLGPACPFEDRLQVSLRHMALFLGVLMGQIAERKTTDLQRETKVGRRLHELRKAAKLSITELGVRAGVSAGMISQVERGLSNPSIKILEKLHLALSVPLTALLEDEPAAPALEAAEDAADIVRRADDRPFLKVGKQGMTKELLTPRGDYQLQLILVGLPASASSEEGLMGEGEKAGWMLSGTVVLTVGDRSVELCEGDSFEFPANQPHAVRNSGDAEARLLWVMNVKPNRPHL